MSLGKVRHQFTYGHLGWRTIRGEHVYLHAGGGIGPFGSLSDVDIQVAEALRRYTLPDPPEDPRSAIASVFELLEQLPDAVVLPLVAVIVSAPVDAMLGGIASVLVLGGTGMRKSSLVAALLHLAGGPWTAKTPPSTWESTANGLERLAHACAQTVFWVDDIRPAATRREHDNTASATQRLLREVVTRAGRQRLAPDITARPVYYPRGPIITTAEHLPHGASTLARLLIVPMQSVGDDVLSKLQATAPVSWPSCGAAWVQYIAKNYDALVEALPKVFTAYRTEAGKRNPGSHLGLVDSAAGYLGAWRAFLQFAISKGVFDEASAERWFLRLQVALDSAVQVTHRALDTERAESEYLEIIRELLELDQISIDNLPDFPTTNGAVSAGWYVDSEGVVYLKARCVGITAILVPGCASRSKQRGGALTLAANCFDVEHTSSPSPCANQVLAPSFEC